MNLPSTLIWSLQVPNCGQGIHVMAASYDLFISYTQKDGEIAASLARQLRDAGVTCFMADRRILAAAEWEPTLREALRSSKRVLLLMTPPVEGKPAHPPGSRLPGYSRP